ncbi:Meiotically up-regulated gene 56 protein [Hypsizygus marmoreus]|uniref:Meiotically up-regulated gene 56 protein n=1 Tax=Hypsizygus marmoreus TaxID=39966 RepID=A0A369J984_HYPMA|nr:Meiotically up-regulated gene 56 protein [Hypsizygus marmoreus]
MAPNTLPSILVTPADSSPDPEHAYAHRRMFVGPVPEKVISQTEAQRQKQQKFFRAIAEDERDNIPQIFKQSAFSFFIREGGKPEDWGETEEQNVVEEMYRRWKHNEWAHIWTRRKEEKAPVNRQTSRWVGGSFEIGQFLGVNILVPERESIRRGPSTISAPKLSPSGSQAAGQPFSMGHETFVTAPPQPEPPVPSTSQSKADLDAHENGGSDSVGRSLHTSSSTSLLRPIVDRVRIGARARTVSVSRPEMKVSSMSALSNGRIPASQKGKGKQVRYADSAPQEPVPAPPSEVLERTGVAMDDTSAGASEALVESTSAGPAIDWGDVVLRDRMLVRSYHCKSDNISPQFDEVHNRTTRHLEDANWAEYMVAWRRDRIELYKDYRIPGKEWVFGHKDLAFVIPLKSARTQLSLYSFVDMTFCITCPPTTAQRDSSTSRRFFRWAKEGTNIFIFNLKSRSRAYDWIWQLWRQLGGELPTAVEVRNPRLNTRVRIDIPTTDDQGIYEVCSRENIIALCKKSLRSVGDWNNLIEREVMKGKVLELAWRVDTNLDWIWREDDVDGESRPWAVLCGLALKQASQPAVLEIHLAEHYPTHIHLRNGSRLHAPPAVEGYLERIRPNTQAKQGIYLTTHDGNLFLLAPGRAHPPSPPGLAPDSPDIESFAQALRKSEAQRGALQIMDAVGVGDLRSVLLIRRAFHVAAQPVHNERKSDDDDIFFSIWSQPEQRTQSDEEDEGGQEALTKSEDKPLLRMRRSFELLLTTGHVIRFEAHSCKVAIEWIERLRALVLYWKQRHRNDAKEEMDLAQAHRQRLTPLTRAFRDGHEHPPEAPPDVTAALPALGYLYNWCILDGCKPITKGGKIFVRRGLRGQYKLVQMFLLAGHLAQFHITPGSSLHASMHKKTSLIDAYVCSGYLAASALPRGQYSPNSRAAPRRYRDGLEADDPEEDMIFMLWYHPQPLKIQVDGVDGLSAAPKNIPALSAKRKMLVFRTRSKLERDAWCWALNCEIERLVRQQKERENKLRETGSLMSL